MGWWELKGWPSSLGSPASVLESGLGGIVGLGTTAKALVLLLEQGGVCEGKIEKSIAKAE